MPNYHSIFEEDKYYHIFNRANNEEKLFLTADNYHYFLYKWSKYISPFAETLAYCLLPNHFHFLIHIITLCDTNLTKPLRLSKVAPADINSILEEQFRRLFMSYVLAFNKQQKRKGSLFQKRFRRIEISSDDYLTKVIHYLHHNPIHHNLTKDYGMWKYSSYNAITSDFQTNIKETWYFNGLVVEMLL